MKYKTYFDDVIDCPGCGAENKLVKGGKRYFLKQFSCISCRQEIHTIYRRYEAKIDEFRTYIIFYAEAYMGEYLPEELKTKQIVIEWLERT